jgi:hypothetical protein
MYDSRSVRMKKEMTSREQEKIELINELEFRLSDIYINSKARR